MLAEPASTAQTIGMISVLPALLAMFAMRFLRVAGGVGAAVGAEREPADDLAHYAQVVFSVSGAVMLGGFGVGDGLKWALGRSDGKFVLLAAGIGAIWGVAVGLERWRERG